jgi:hypothetical protein
LGRAFAEDETDEKGAMLRSEVEDHALLLHDAKRPAEPGAGMTPKLGKGRVGRMHMLEQGSPEIGRRTESATELVRRRRMSGVFECAESHLCDLEARGLDAWCV